MKWFVGIALILSLAINAWLICDEVQDSIRREFGQSMNRAMGISTSKNTWSEGAKLFRSRLKQKHSALAQKKYFYVNIWTNWCRPCLHEMPWLDSIAGTLGKENVAYLFVSPISDSLANTTLKRKNYRLKNFVFLNDMHDFVSSVSNEQQGKTIVYPMTLILTNTGKVLHYSTGAYSNKQEALGFAELINRVCVGEN